MPHDDTLPSLTRAYTSNAARRGCA